MPRIDPKIFNTDPKHETDRNDFDALVESAFVRITEKKKRENPQKGDENIFDQMADWFSK